MVEFAVFTVVFVPLALYGSWLGDVMHLGIRAQEASIEPVFDATAVQIHNFSGGGGNKTSQAASGAQNSAMGRLSTSFDGAQPSASADTQSIFAKPKNLKIACRNEGPSFTFKGKDKTLQPEDTWMSCSSKLDIDTPLGEGKMPSGFRDADEGQALLPASMFSLHLCGVGPGVSGCGNSGNAKGLPIYLDDWGTEEGGSNPLGSQDNKAYYNVAEKYYIGGASAAKEMREIAQLPELATTSTFRLTYRRVESNGSYDATENRLGQSGPHGGPSNPHTGGAWHDESSPTNLNKDTFNDTRTNKKYMANKNWGDD